MSGKTAEGREPAAAERIRQRSDPRAATPQRRAAIAPNTAARHVASLAAER
ncbi:hypothetical protein C7S16_7156 [Burkholderia thailandensis]|uniref:Uncharacterized protein n=1 Tax=Burkholderia thailandensis TaxID=57975 RepID=A0AAW9CLF6_BURTH|nr:hypothetical protein [Burkholderia thailandensis]MDW9251800.1 hypothetical protein [Burkholderia thailandensis]